VTGSAGWIPKKSRASSVAEPGRHPAAVAVVDVEPDLDQRMLALLEDLGIRGPGGVHRWWLA
jgi:hypothetical protein